jgi:hypothetical protein
MIISIVTTARMSFAKQHLHERTVIELICRLTQLGVTYVTA